MLVPLSVSDETDPDELTPLHSKRLYAKKADAMTTAAAKVIKPAVTPAEGRDDEVPVDPFTWSA